MKHFVVLGKCARIFMLSHEVADSSEGLSSFDDEIVVHSDHYLSEISGERTKEDEAALDLKKVLIDIGSTFTKVVILDLEKEEVISTVSAPSTVEEDVNIGLREALEKAETEVGHLDGKEMIACSSAAGGLRVVSIGLVPELSSEAARRAALGAGAKIVGHFSHDLPQSEIRKIENIRPDLLLLVGGTDGGNLKTIVHNATMLAHSKVSAPIIVAGNKCATDKIEQIFNASPKVVARFANNVMPEIGKLEVDDCREAMREVFMQNIVKAKGIDKARELVSDIIMPTPVAVLNAAVLLANGVDGEEGLGEIIVVDIGGATTDIDSVAWGRPSQGGVLMKGLPEPFAKRTVEGDLGVRHNIDVLIQIGKEKGIVLDPEVISTFQSQPSRVPKNQIEWSVDNELARIAVETAFERHVGKIEVVYGPMGEMLTQVGKDFCEVTKVIGTGGPIVFSSYPQKILSGIITHSERARLLKPKKPDFYVDEKYIMYAMGLLAQFEPRRALKIMKKYLKPI
jgi:uncharacterized protein (TIGR01319 family)